MIKIKVLFVDTNKLSIDALLSSSYLKKEDKDILLKFKNERAKKEKACSFILKNKIIGEYHLNEFDKPISDNAYFNISHSDGVVVLATAERPIGVDIEKIRTRSNSLVDHISSKEEKEYIKDDINFYEVWTNKEALVKCLGTGIRKNVKDIPALPLDGKKVYQGHTYFSKTIQHFDYVISVVLESDGPFDVEIMDVEI